MTQLILAIDQNGGLGANGKLPWHNTKELEIFRNKTMNNYLLMGRKTAESLPKLRNRKIICLSRTITTSLQCQTWNNIPHKIINDISQIHLGEYPDNSLFIAGGAEVYKKALETPGFVKTIHISIMNNTYIDCDTFFDTKLLKNFVIINQEKFEDFFHYVLEYRENGEQQYLDLLEKIICKGEKRKGRNGEVTTLFKNDFVFDLRNGFPLLTTKKMFLRGILEEFLFFVRGDTDSQQLSDKKIRIWEGNTSKEFIEKRNLPYAPGVMGPLYGYQWRFFNSEYNLDDTKRPIKGNRGIDQLQNVIDLINNDPHSRRILLVSYNPEQAEQGVLYPCHSITIQFFVQDGYLDMFCYNRSQDATCGIPFNIASSSLLLMCIAKITNKKPRFFHMTMGDTHIYEEHINFVNKQIDRIPYKFPELIIPDFNSIKELENKQAIDFKLVNYNSHPPIKVSMVA